MPSPTANADDDVRVIILGAAGDTFSSGHDIGTPEEKEDMRRRPFPKGVRGEYALSRYLFLDTTLRWRDLDKPTIAQVQGMCIFGGWMFAAAMDLIVASDDAKFLPALMQYFSIPWDIPIRKAKEAMFRSRFIDAEEACRSGFVNLVVPRERLEEETLAFAKEIARKRSLHAQNVEIGGQFRAGCDGLQQLDPQRSFALHGPGPRQLHQRQTGRQGLSESDAGRRPCPQITGGIVALNPARWNL